MRVLLIALAASLCACACAPSTSLDASATLPTGPQSVMIATPDGEQLGATWWPAEQAGPGVVLLGVAGPNDRRLSFGPLAPFEATARALNLAGVHVLSFDDRGVGASTGDWTQLDFEQMAADATAAADWLGRQPGVRSDSVGFYGLSEGSGVALHAAAAGVGDFLILGSPPGVAGEHALRGRLVAALDAQGAPDALRAQYLAAFDQFLALSRSGDVDGLEAFVSGPGRALVPPYSFVPSDAASQARLLASPWSVAQLDYDPEPLLGQIDVPVLIIGGALDPVLAPALNHPPLLAGIKQAEAVLIADANHLLIPAETGSPMEYAVLSADMHPDVIAAILEWMRDRDWIDEDG